MFIKANKINSCYIGPQISSEQFIAEHFFLFLLKGSIQGYDGHKSYSLKAGEACIVRKNHLARYRKQKEDGNFEKVVVVFDQEFLKQYQEKYRIYADGQSIKNAFFAVAKNELITSFITSLAPYYEASGVIDEYFTNVKREELLLILLKNKPELVNILFDFGKPEKIDLEAFMNQNFRFNVAIQRFAFLTGRSLTVFKQDFKRIFNDTPSHWLLRKRLQEAYFLINKKGRKASDVYLEVGFEDLSHFSFTFKKLFDISPSQLSAQYHSKSI